MEKTLNYLPRAVREQAERAEAAHLAILAGNTVQTAPGEATEAPQVTLPPADLTPVAPVVELPVVVETPPIATNVDPWELKYKVLNGKYQSEVPRMAADIRDLREQLRTATLAVSAPAEPAAQTHAGMTTQAVTEQYGEDFTAAVSAIAEQASKKLRDDLSSKVEAVEADSASRRRNDFLGDLTSLVPNWRQIDQDAGFTAYLDEIDTQTGRSRREFFNEADRVGNAARIASFFAAFADNKPTAVVPPAPAPVPSVEHLIAPDSSRSSEAPPGKKLWTRAEVGQFYADARAQGGSKPYGRFTAAEYDRIDSDISAAAAEGRYVG